MFGKFGNTKKSEKNYLPTQQTRDDAKEKICPFMSNSKINNCIAEKCMAWIPTKGYCGYCALVDSTDHNISSREHAIRVVQGNDYY